MKASNRLHARLMCAASALALTLGTAAHAEVRQFDIPAGSLGEALAAFGMQSDLTVVTTTDITRSKSSKEVAVAAEPETALAQLLGGTGLTFRREGDTFLIVRADSGPQAGSAAGGGAEVEALIVTAQKREEDIQDVPIAMSAFTQEALTTAQIAGGPDLMTQIPNFTFTKTNFSSYSIQIRGIGTQAISATVDPAVAVAMNNTPFIRNRFFEQEFYDLNRVEVLRGPQGTLYGRNATAGVVNLITAKPEFFYENRLSADIANYGSARLEGMINLPLAEDKVALRLAGAWTKRDGFVTNGITGEQIDGRDLWSARATLRVEPTDSIRATLTYEHFEEDDDRLRSGKQLCKRDPNRTEIGGIPIPQEAGGAGTGGGHTGVLSYTTQGCQMADLYSDESFQVPNGFALPYFGPLRAVAVPINADIDPYVSTTQSHDLRVIDSTLTPEYRASTDIIHFAFEIDLTDSLTVTSETGYLSDELFSFQDFNRFNTSSGIFEDVLAYVQAGILSPEGVFCDPQLGCADRLVAADVSTARSDQFSQEVRLSSNFDGPMNFHIGANFLRYDTVDKYYVFINSLSLYTASSWLFADEPYNPRVSFTDCLLNDLPVNPNGFANNGCFYLEPNGIDALSDEGHNYFLSKNPFRLISSAVFGEIAYNITPTLKITGGLRYTVDQKHAPVVPSWLLTSGFGHPVREIIEQEWREPTGRAVIDWKPDLGFTDETLIYASYAHGYKAGGTNPPLPGALPLGELFDSSANIVQIETLQPPEFGPEFIDAYEIGAKNTLLDGRLTLNASAFYYDYEGYQISQIVNRSAINLNFDAEVWGAELEADWRPFDNLKISLKGGWEKTRLADGQSAVDMIDRTAGTPGWLVIKPFPTVPSNCVLPEEVVAMGIRVEGLNYFGNIEPCGVAYLQGLDPVTNLPYVENPTQRRTGGETILPLDPLLGYEGFDPTTAPNNGWGFSKDVGGNELPNAPDFTTTLSVDYTIPLREEWLLTLHTDLYRQSEAWTRIFNEDPYDRLKPYVNINFAALFLNEEAGWRVMAYVKNVLDTDSITGAFLNSDDTGLTTNVFLTEPRLYGLRVTKTWTGEPWWNVDPGATGLPITIELGGMVERRDAPNRTFAPGFTEDFSDVLAPAFATQEEDLDWGDSHEVRLTYSPASSPWSMSLGARSGRSNGTSGLITREQTTGGWFGPTGVEEPSFCQGSCLIEGPINYARSEVRDREEYSVAEFFVGRDVSFGQASQLSGGLRYARLESETAVQLYGVPNYEVPSEWLVITPATRTSYEARFEASRSFEGVGPVLSWTSEFGILGDTGAGRLALDWSLSGGVLFGEQETVATSSESGSIATVRITPQGLDDFSDPLAGSYVTPPMTVTRSDDVTVPFSELKLGLSYDVGRVKVGAGYRWERYFDALDVGYDEAKDADRTIDGPYFKIAVGFGG